MRICLIRHGETDWNIENRLQGREDIPLNRNGILQAEQCAAALSKRKWGAVFTSPLLRARRTAEIIACTNGIKVYVKENLTERDYGKASGLTSEEREAKYPDGKYEGIEDWNVMKDRFLNAVLECAAESKGQDIIIVSHGGVINSILAALSNHTIGTGKTRLKNVCLNMLEYKSNVLVIISYNKSPDESEL